MHVVVCGGVHHPWGNTNRSASSSETPRTNAKKCRAFVLMSWLFLISGIKSAAAM